MTPACGHPICGLVGGACALATGLSRGCQTGPRGGGGFAPAVVDEVRALLVVLDLPPADSPGARVAQVAAATRLAFLFRREARDGRSLMALADELEGELVTRLDALCRRAPRP